MIKTVTNERSICALYAHLKKEKRKNCTILGFNRKNQKFGFLLFPLILKGFCKFPLTWHDSSLQAGMSNVHLITAALRKLCELELYPTRHAEEFTPKELRYYIADLRKRIPSSILGHHDRKIQRKRPSIVPVQNGICSACHLRLPVGHLAKLQHKNDLEVCDNCGTFIYSIDKPHSTASAATATQKSSRTQSLQA